ncbi:hypothetical protein WN51_13398 [Melipona quadrifasciata]|uniref:Uncharacterized protein n=1 Tax=Melipona quadrifasciata TaxID=166423 RepID=A0A0N0BGV3_9HYME|nr:hypothetical protein WN51_13398 [Melipona quadrifasciata]
MAVTKLFDDGLVSCCWLSVLLDISHGDKDRKTCCLHLQQVLILSRA